MSEHQELKIIGMLLEAVCKKHLCLFNQPDNSIKYFPAPLVGHVLKSLRDIKPDAFEPLHILPIGIDTTSQHARVHNWQITVWLPNCNIKDSRIINEVEKAKDEEDPQNNESLKALLWTGQIDGKDKEQIIITGETVISLIARYVAAMVIGQAVSLVPEKIILDYYSKGSRDGWGEVIDRALKENGGPLMETYLTQLGCKPAAFQSSEVLETQTVSADKDDLKKLSNQPDIDLSILGIDVGGTAIKFVSYTVDEQGKVVTASDKDPIPPKEVTKILNEHSGPFIDADDFARYIVDLLTKEGWLSTNFTAIGIGLPAPVRVQHGVPLAPSGGVAKLFGMEKEIGKANTADFHKLKLADAMREHFGCVVVLMNDGEADIRDSENEIMMTSGEGTTIVLKVGTGVAFGSYSNTEPTGINSEIGKAVLNLLCDPQSTPYETRFQQGQLNKYCSKNAYDELEIPETLKGFGSITYDQRDVAVKKDVDKASTHIGKLLTEAFEGRLIGRKDEDNNMANFLNPDSFLIGQTPEELYEKACVLYLRRYLGKSANDINQVYDDKQANIQELVEEARKKAKFFPPLNWSQLTTEQKLAVRVTLALGRWLADAIALVVEVFGSKEIRLAGGPLSSETGLLVTKSAVDALENIYGFDLDEVWDTFRTRPAMGHEPVSPSRRREVKRLRLYYPPTESAESGPRGAAKAALDAYIRQSKQEQLLFCRDEVAKQPSGGKGFDPQDIIIAGNAAWKKEKNSKTRPPLTWLLESDEITKMLLRESSALAISRTAGGNFRKYRG